MLFNQILKDKFLKGPMMQQSKYAPTVAVTFKHYVTLNLIFYHYLAMGAAAISHTSQFERHEYESCPRLNKNQPNHHNLRSLQQ